MQAYLSEVGIDDEHTLREIGPVSAFIRIRGLSKHLKNRMALYALYGALSDQNCMRLPEETKAWLEKELKRVGYK